VHLPIVVLIHFIFFSSVKQVSIAPFYETLIAVVGCAYAFCFVFERPALSQMLKNETNLVARASPQADKSVQSN